MCVKTDEAQGFFDTYLSVSRADLETLSFDASNVSVVMMREIAHQIGKSEAVMAAWWMAVEYAAEGLGIPKKHREQEENSNEI